MHHSTFAYDGVVFNIELAVYHRCSAGCYQHSYAPEHFQLITRVPSMRLYAVSELDPSLYRTTWLVGSDAKLAIGRTIRFPASIPSVDMCHASL